LDPRLRGDDEDESKTDGSKFGRREGMTDKTPSILMVSWNRSEYYRRTMAHLLSDPSDFRLHLWDNGSEDGLADYINELRDDRIVDRRLNAENVGQFEPWHWFVENCATGVGGKLDDDILGEAGWMTRFADMLVAEPQLGLMGGWVFLREEWDAAAGAHKIRQVGDYSVFQNTWVAGCIFLGRIEVLKRFAIHDPKILGVPIDHVAITRSGLVSGFPLPMSFAHNLDDPRSPYCRMNRPGGWDKYAAYTARMRNFSGPEEYGEWIAADARALLTGTIEEQLAAYDPPSFAERVRRKFMRLAGRPVA
jgi:Glycosyl transferase family 2